MRDKLIELLENVDGESGFLSLSSNDAIRIADYLIANGVVVQPIAKGSTVYALYNRTMHRNKISNSQITTNSNLELAWHRGGNIEIREKKATKQDITLLGRLTFISKEEAERKLKESS